MNPYLVQTPQKLKLPPTYKEILIWDVFRDQKTERVLWKLVSLNIEIVSVPANTTHFFQPSRTKLAALYSATKSLQNSCTAKLQLFSSLLEAKQQLHSSCSGMQKRCAAFEGSLKLSAAVLQRSCRLSNAAKQLQ